MKARVKAEIAERARSNARVVLPVIALIYIILGVVYLIAPPLRPGGVFAALNLYFGTALAVLWLTTRRIPTRYVHLVNGAATICALGNALGFVILTGDPVQSVVLVVTLLGAAYLLLNVWSTAILTGLSLAIWFWLARDFPQAAFTHWAINLVITGIVALTITWSRVRLEQVLAMETHEARDARDQVAAQAAKLERQADALVLARDTALSATKAKSQFLANMSHEIRTPLNAVVGLSNLLLDSKLGADQREHAELLKSSAHLLLGIVNDILDFSRIEAGKLSLEPEPFDLTATVETLCTTFSMRAAQKGLQLEHVLASDVPNALLGDSGRLRQILSNLLDNAIKFSRQGEVTLEITRDAGDDTWALLRFAVRDTGPGIPADKLSHLFQAFSQVDASVTREFGGTGLGLAISKELADLMGGDIGVETVTGRGSVFWFTARMQLQTAPPTTQSEHSTPPPTDAAPPRSDQPAHAERILVVEDNRVNQLVAVGLLRKLGYQSDVVDNGKLAMDALQSGTYQLVIMDVQMPVMDGFEATRKIRAGGPLIPDPAIPIIAMTAHAMTGDREKCLAAGMNDYVTKPVEADTLADVLSRWLS